MDDIVDFVAQVESEPELLNRPSTEEFLIVKVGHMIKSPSPRGPVVKPDLKALAGIPIDSLIAIEARAWARKRLGVQISLSDITAAGNVKGLVSLAIDGMKKRYSTYCPGCRLNVILYNCISEPVLGSPGHEY